MNTKWVHLGHVGLQVEAVESLLDALLVEQVVPLGRGLDGPPARVERLALARRRGARSARRRRRPLPRRPRLGHRLSRANQSNSFVSGSRGSSNSLAIGFLPVFLFNSIYSSESFVISYKCSNETRFFSFLISTIDWIFLLARNLKK